MSSIASSSACVASRRLRFNPMAEAELQDAAAWYDERSSGLGLRFVLAVRRKSDEILESPQRWPVGCRLPPRPPGPVPLRPRLPRDLRRRDRDRRRRAPQAASVVLVW